MLISLRQLLDDAAEHGYGVPAFNINNMEQGLAILKAADRVDAPVIIQASRGARNYAGDVMLQAMVKALAEMYPHIPVCMHQDHGNNEATCMTAIQYGFTSVMMDGSLEADAKTPASYAYNLDITNRVTEMAHHAGVSVEGELGVLGSLETGEGEQEDGHGATGKLSEDQLLTDPDQAVDFVKQTKVDADRQGERRRGGGGIMGGGIMAAIWEPFGSNLGAIWEAFGSNLGSIWEQYGSRRPREPMSRPGCNKSTPLQPFAKVPVFAQFHEVFLRVGVTKYQFLHQTVRAGSVRASPPWPWAPLPTPSEPL